MQTAFVLKRKGHRRNKVIKYRQGGFTTFRCIELLDKAIWYPGTTCAIVAHEREAVTKIFRIVKRAYDNLPEEIRPKIKYNNKSELEFIEDFTGRKLDSNIYVALKLRSGTNKYLHISESAYIEGEARQELNAGSKETVPKDGDITEETTANGFNEFQAEVDQAIKDWDSENGIPQKYKTKVYFFSWLENKDYRFEGVKFEDLGELNEEEKRLVDLGADAEQLAWRRWKIKEIGADNDSSLLLTPEQKFKQEYPATLQESFQASGKVVFDSDLVDKIPVVKPVRIEDYVKYWEEPKDGARYIIGVDPSKGKGVDNAAMSVWDVKEYRKVAEYHGYCDPDVLAQKADTLGRYYNEAFIVVENNILSTILALKDIYPPNKIYTHVRENKITNEKTKELGFPTTVKTRPMLIDNYNKFFRENELYIPSSVSKSEMRTFIIKESGKAEHAYGRHDDMLFADMLAVYGIPFMPANTGITWF